MNTQAPVAERADVPVRVVLVGRTALAGVDAALRRDRGVELVRARTAIAAIGEAATPIDEQSPRDLTLIVAPEAVSADRAGAFAGAVHRVDARARLLCLGDHVLEGFDGAVPVHGQSVDADELRLAVRHEPAPVAATAPDETDFVEAFPPAHTDDAPAQTTAATPAVGMPQQRNPQPPDTGPAEALATGHDPVAAALESLKARWNLTEAIFTPAQGDGSGADAPGFGVWFNGREIGRLRTDPPLPAEAAAAETVAIAPWVVLARQQEQLRRAAFTDELTGAWNRRYFNRFLAAAINDATQKRHTVTLLVFDVDNFKSYNDRFGHAAGDEILVEMVRLLNGSIRTTDRVCRIGGDEFAVIFHDPAGPRTASGTTAAGGPTSPQSIGDIVRRFQGAICEHRFPKLAELAAGTLTISGGMATFPWDGRTVQQLLDKADALALQSKQEGKNKIAFGPGAAHVCGG